MKIDKELLDKAIENKDTEAVLSQCNSIIHFYINKYGFNRRFPSWVDDFEQEGKIALLKALNDWDKNRAGFLTYAHYLVRNAVISSFRKMKWANNENDYNEFEDEKYSKEYGMKPLTMYETLVEEMEKDVNGNVLKLFYLDDYTQDEVAKMVGMSQQWVGTITLSFKKKMRFKYGKMFGINTYDERIKLYESRTYNGDNDDFKINGKIVGTYHYSEHDKSYSFYDHNNRLIAEIGDCEEMPYDELVQLFGDAL
jgi:RNA polymerase sigma factor (sigma-70 family)